MQTQTILQERKKNDAMRLYDDRKHLMNKLCTIGYIPDYDLRKQINDIRTELNNRIEYQREELRNGGAL